MIKSMKKQCKFTTEPPADLDKDYIVDISKTKIHIESSILESENPLCMFCGKTNLPGSKFCNHCGQLLPISNKCRKCNHDNPNDAIFCNHCGNNLRSST
jgi:ribosomal protein L40E